MAPRQQKSTDRLKVGAFEMQAYSTATIVTYQDPRLTQSLLDFAIDEDDADELTYPPQTLGPGTGQDRQFS